MIVILLMFQVSWSEPQYHPAILLNPAPSPNLSPKRNGLKTPKKTEYG
jgi:hypothetical protein